MVGLFLFIYINQIVVINKIYIIMTLEINKTLSQQMLRIVWDCYPDSEIPQTLRLENVYSKSKYTIELGLNYSIVKYRFGMYLLNESQLVDLPDGIYIYEVVDSGTYDECHCPTVYAKGTLMVGISPNSEEAQSLRPIEFEGEDNSSDDFIVYNG